MDDLQIILTLTDKAGGTAPLSRRLNVTRQTIYNWRSSGIPGNYRFAVAALAAEYGIGLPDGFAALGPPEGLRVGAA